MIKTSINHRREFGKKSIPNWTFRTLVGFWRERYVKKILSSGYNRLCSVSKLSPRHTLQCKLCRHPVGKAIAPFAHQVWSIFRAPHRVLDTRLGILINFCHPPVEVPLIRMIITRMIIITCSYRGCHCNRWGCICCYCDDWGGNGWGRYRCGILPVVERLPGRPYPVDSAAVRFQWKPFMIKLRHLTGFSLEYNEIHWTNTMNTLHYEPHYELHYGV